MPTMTAAPAQTQAKSPDQTRPPSSLDKAFADIMMRQNWDPKRYPYMYQAIYGQYDMFSLPGLVNVAVGKVDSGLRKGTNLGMQWIGALDGMGGPNSNPHSELDQLNQQLITYGQTGGRKPRRQQRKEMLDKEIEMALMHQQALSQAKEDPLAQPDIKSAQEIAAKSQVKLEDRILGADLQASKELVDKIESIFNNSLDPNVKADVAHMDNQALPGERELKEPQMLYPDRTNDRGRDRAR